MNANYPSFPLSIGWHFLPIAQHYLTSAIKEKAGNVIIIQQHTLRHTRFLFIHSCASLYKHRTASNSLANCHQCPAVGIKCIYSPLFRAGGQALIRANSRRTDADQHPLLVHKACVIRMQIYHTVKTLQNIFRIWNIASHYNDPTGSPSVRTHILIDKSEALCPSPCLTLKQHTRFEQV